jgi:hypothetical protein
MKRELSRLFPIRQSMSKLCDLTIQEIIPKSVSDRPLPIDLSHTMKKTRVGIQQADRSAGNPRFAFKRALLPESQFETGLI